LLAESATSLYEWILNADEVRATVDLHDSIIYSIGTTYNFEFWHQRDLMGAIIKVLQNPEVSSKIEWDPYQLYIEIGGKRVYGDFNMGNIAWEQAVSSFCTKS
jgi:hypothetical protein